MIIRFGVFHLDMEVFLQKDQKFLGGNKIGAAISGPGLAGRKITDVRLFRQSSPPDSLEGLFQTKTPQGDFMEDLLRSLWGVLGGIFRSCPLTSQKLPLCGNQQTVRISGQLLRSLLQNPRNFSEVTPDVRCIRLFSV